MSTSSWMFANPTGPRFTTINYCEYCGKPRDEWGKDSYIPYCSYRCKKLADNERNSVLDNRRKIALKHERITNKNKRIALSQRTYIREEQIREINNCPNYKRIGFATLVFFALLYVFIPSSTVEYLESILVLGVIILLGTLFIDTNSKRLWRNPFKRIVVLPPINSDTHKRECEDTSLGEFFPVGEDSDDRDTYEDWADWQSNEEWSKDV